MKVCDDQRRALRASLAGTIPAQHLDEITDLAIHAAESAITVLFNVGLKTHPDPRIGTSAIGPAAGILLAMVETVLDGIKTYGREHGLPVIELTLPGIPA